MGGEGTMEAGLARLGIGDEADLSALPRSAGGRWRIDRTDRGVYRISGRYKGGAQTADIFIDGILVRRHRLLDSKAAAQQFRLRVGKSILAVLPEDARVEIVVGSERLAQTLREGLPEVLPGLGDPGLFRDRLREGYYITKKGDLVLPLARSAALQAQVLAAYAALDRALREDFGYPLWLAHGTLLGLVRDGGFLEKDDDFDTAYLSSATSVEAAMAERSRIAAAMISRGLEVTLTAPSGLIRCMVAGASIDIMPGWRQDGRFYCLGFTMLNLDEADILPVVPGELAGHRVHLPRDPEKFLAAKYGPAWGSPDPSYVARRPDGSLPVLTQGFLTPDQARSLTRQARAEAKTLRKLASSPN